MKRRAFITLRGGAAAWPLTASGQQPEHSAASLSFMNPTDREGWSRNAVRQGSGPPEKVFNEFWKPSRGRLGARRGRKVLDDHKAVDFSLQIGV